MRVPERWLPRGSTALPSSTSTRRTQIAVSTAGVRAVESVGDSAGDRHVTLVLSDAPDAIRRLCTGQADGRSGIQI